MKNTFRLEGKDDEIISKDHGSLDDIEHKIISDNFDNPEDILEIVSHLSSEKKEGETVTVYEERIIKDGTLALEKIKNV